MLLIAVGGNTLTLIPLFAIGVFTGFTLSQSRAGRPLVADPARRAGGDRRASTGSARSSPASPPRCSSHEVHRRGLGGRGGGPRAHVACSSGSTATTDGHAGRAVGPRRVARQARREGHRGGRAGDRRLPAGRIRASREALSIGEHVVAVTVVARRGPTRNAARASELHGSGRAGTPGVPLRVLRTEYASIAARSWPSSTGSAGAPDEPIVVLIPVVCPTGFATASCTTTSTRPHRRCGTGRTSSSPASRCECASETAPHRCGLRARVSGAGEDQPAEPADLRMRRPRPARDDDCDVLTAAGPAQAGWAASLRIMR